MHENTPLGQKGLNLRMSESKSDAFPLGYALYNLTLRAFSLLESLTRPNERNKKVCVRIDFLICRKLVYSSSVSYDAYTEYLYTFSS